MPVSIGNLWGKEIREFPSASYINDSDLLVFQRIVPDNSSGITYKISMAVLSSKFLNKDLTVYSLTSELFNSDIMLINRNASPLTITIEDARASWLNLNNVAFAHKALPNVTDRLFLHDSTVNSDFMRWTTIAELALSLPKAQLKTHLTGMVTGDSGVHVSVDGLVTLHIQTSIVDPNGQWPFLLKDFSQYTLKNLAQTDTIAINSLSGVFSSTISNIINLVPKCYLTINLQGQVNGTSGPLQLLENNIVMNIPTTYDRSIVQYKMSGLNRESVHVISDVSNQSSLFLDMNQSGQAAGLIGFYTQENYAQLFPNKELIIVNQQFGALESYIALRNTSSSKKLILKGTQGIDTRMNATDVDWYTALLLDRIRDAAYDSCLVTKGYVDALVSRDSCPIIGFVT